MTGIGIVDKLILFLNLGAVASALGVFIYTNVIYKKPAITDSESYREFIQEMETKNNRESFELGALTTNLVSRSKRLRFVSMSPQLVPLKTKYLDLLNDNKSIIIDTIIEIASKMPPEELNSLSGKLVLETRIKNRLTQIFGKPVLQNIYFTKFIIQ